MVFYVLTELSLEHKKYQQHIYHIIGKYNCKGEYMVHRVYICSNHKSYFIVQKYDQLEGCNSYNLVMSSFSSFVLKKHDKSQEGEHSLLLPTTCPSTKVKPRTVCYQEGDDDEDMTPIDTPMKVKNKVTIVPICLQNYILRIWCYLILSL
jgi:hypothetical protein